jgi:hypothetical protein
MRRDGLAWTGLVPAALVLVHCGARTSIPGETSTDAGASVVPDVYAPPPLDAAPPPFDAGAPDAPSCNATPIVGEVPPNHRSVATPCAPSGNPYGYDAGLVACGADGGCPFVQGTEYEPQCIGGICRLQDQCSTDSDCSSPSLCGSTPCACACSSEQVYPNSPVQPNVCMPAKCHLDSDCRPGAYCAFSLSTFCGRGGVGGFYCTTPQDRCVDPSRDCTTCTGKSCSYDPEVGWWVCASAYAGVCNG